MLPCRLNETKPSFEKEEEEKEEKEEEEEEEGEGKKKKETKIKKRIIHFAAVERLRVASLDSL